MNWRDAEATYDDDVLGETTLARMFEESAARNADAIAQRYKGGIYDRSLAAADVVPAAPDGAYADLTYAEMRALVRRLAAGFRDLGVAPGDRVGVLSDTRMEWAQTDFALLSVGGVVTTVYTSSSESQIQYLLSDPGASGVVVENADLLSHVLAVEKDLSLEFIVVIDEIPDGSGMGGAVRDRDDIYTLADVHARGAAVFDEDDVESWLAAREVDDLASLIYTSGTTGRPKGVELTHRNFRSNVNQSYRRFGPRPDRTGGSISPEATTLSFLPLAHVFERLAGHYLMFAAGATVAYAESPDTLREDFGLVRPTVGTSVPRVYEKLYDAIRSQASESPIKRRIFEWAVDVGRAHQSADDPGAVLDAKLRIADRLVFQQVREALGDRVDFLISGGGSLSPELCRLYHAMGLPILEGYGLTETSPVVAANPPEAPKIGTIGPPLTGVETRLDPSIVGDGVGGNPGTHSESDDTGAHSEGGNPGTHSESDAESAAATEVGELLVRGPNVTAGYWNRPDQTAAAFTEDGWFRTGDIVERGPDDYLRFRERAKQLLVLSTGKNVAPGPIEDGFAASPVIEQCVVVGDGRKFVSALLVPNFEGLREWAGREGIDLPAERAAICRDERAVERIQREVDAVNDGLESYERIKQFRVLSEEFSESDNTLTPTMKKKRRNILDRYADQIEMLYE
ncbi:AMP-dependent synthetase/ligase [Halobellus captivus]|uniref:AMP-dependent synthetase/ligase n=1 Tax=Halobellus captivus TaxID=2592614 RepID=UPI00119F522C|nr:long-chain fatty acid--CoA ligase [Halobellus captivus]